MFYYRHKNFLQTLDLGLKTCQGVTPCLPWVSGLACEPGTLCTGPGAGQPEVNIINLFFFVTEAAEQSLSSIALHCRLRLSYPGGAPFKCTPLGKAPDLKKLARDKHSSLFCVFDSDDVKKVLWYWHLVGQTNLPLFIQMSQNARTKENLERKDKKIR